VLLILIFKNFEEKKPPVSFYLLRSGTELKCSHRVQVYPDPSPKGSRREPELKESAETQVLASPDFEVVEDSGLMQVGERGEVILTYQNIRVPKISNIFLIHIEFSKPVFQSHIL
jgi:hypothetical protein